MEVCLAPASARPPLTRELLQQLQRLARQYLDDDASAQDAAQATAEALVTQRSPYLARSAYAAYAVAVLRHKIADELRWRRRHAAAMARPATADTADAARPWAELTQPEQRAQQRLQLHAMARKVGALPPAARQVLLLTELYGYHSEEISRRTGMSTGHIWVTLHRGRKRLREQLRHLQPHAD